VRELKDIKNFGPKLVNWMNRIGIHTEEDLLNSDYPTIFRKLSEVGVYPHILIFYSIDMGLQDRKWSDITKNEKAELRSILGLPPK
jgi:hypothetical protein